MDSLSQFVEMFGDCRNKKELDSICDVFIDGDWIEAKDQSDGGIRLVQTGNVGTGFFKDKDDKSRYINEQTFNRLHCSEIFAGDILVSRLPDPIGRACIVPGNLGKAITAVDCTIIRLKDNLSSEFFIGYTCTPMYYEQIKKHITGTTRDRISRGNLGKILCPIPEIEEQLKFVSIFNQADKSKFVDFKSQFVEMIGDQDTNDRAWTTCRIKDKFSLSMGRTPARARHDYWAENGYKWISVSDMANYDKYTDRTAEYITQKAVDESGIKAVEAGIIIMSFKLSLGRTAITSERIYTNEAIIAFNELDESQFDIDFLFYALHNTIVR